MQTERETNEREKQRRRLDGEKEERRHKVQMQLELESSLSNWKGKGWKRKNGAMTRKETNEDRGNKKKGLSERKSSPSEKKSCSDYTIRTRKMKKGEDC